MAQAVGLFIWLALLTAPLWSKPFRKEPVPTGEGAAWEQDSPWPECFEEEP